MSDRKNKIADALERLGDVLEQIADAGTYTPDPAEAAELNKALALLIGIYERKSFAPGEEAAWQCHGITIGGEYKGAWEIKLRRIDADTAGAA